MAEAVGLCPVWIQAQYFDNDGFPLSNGMIWTYVSSTDETVATYTDNTGTVRNTNPIVLDSSGRLTTSIWLKAGSYYGLVLQDQFGQELSRVRDVSYQKLVAGDNITLDPASGTGDVTISAAGPYSGNDNGHGPSTMVYLISAGNLQTGGSTVNNFSEATKVAGAEASWTGSALNLAANGAYTIQVTTKITSPSGSSLGDFPQGLTLSGVQVSYGNGDLIDESSHSVYMPTTGGGLPSQYQKMTYTDVFTVSTTYGTSVSIGVWVFNAGTTGQNMQAELEVIATRFGAPYDHYIPD